MASALIRLRFFVQKICFGNRSMIYGYMLRDTFVSFANKHAFHLLDIAGSDRLADQVLILAFGGQLPDRHHLARRQNVSPPSEDL